MTANSKSEPVLKVGDEVIVARAGAESLGSLAAVVEEVLDDALVLRAEQRMIFIRPGAPMTIRPAAHEELVGWAALDEVRAAGNSTLMRVTAPRWEDCTRHRPERGDVDYRVVLSVLESDPGGGEPRRTVGYAINMSLTGIRVRVRTSLTVGALVHMQIFVGPKEPVIAIGQVARIVAGSEGSAGGYEVGLSFMRFIQGYEEVLAAVGEAWFSGDGPGADEAA